MTFGELDLTDPAAIIEYERAFHDCFIQVTTNRLVHTLWSWDYDARRVATRIPYTEQTIFVLRQESTGALDTAMAFNTRMHRLQAEAFGFDAPREASFEILTFFSLADRTLKTKLDFWSRCLAELRARGFCQGYATTARRPLPFLPAHWLAPAPGGEHRR